MKHTALRLSSAVALVVAGVAATAAPGTAQAPAQTASRHVIVVLKSQHTVATGASESRTAQRSAYDANRTASAGVAAKAKADGASDVHSYGLINGFSATMSASTVAALAQDPAVARVYPDLQISMGADSRQQLAADARGASLGAATGTTNKKFTPGPCPANPADPIVTPEALGVTKTLQANDIVDGTGVKVAFIADGLDTNNQEFIRSGGQHVFVDYQDFSGDGPNAVTTGGEAFGDASSIAAQGLHSYDLSKYVSPKHPLPTGCTITVRGMAPGASLIGLKVFGNSNFAPTSDFIDAIDYAVNAGADVLNESFGANPFPDNGNDPITLADNAAIKAGVTVVASTGDSGTTGTTGSPATDPKVIGVAASTTFQSYAQDTQAGAQLSNGTWVNNNISGLSSGGISQQARTPDLVAPGDSNWALCSTDQKRYTDCANDVGKPSPIQDFGGTSQSAPLTAGAAALVVQAYEQTHGGARPTPALVKRILTSTATDLGHPAYEQGSGLLNSLAAVQAAESWQDAKGSPTAVGKNLVVDQTQLSAVGRPNQVVTKQVSVRNVSDQTVTVKASTRQLGRTKSIAHGTLHLNTATAKFYLDSFNIKRAYVRKRFTVPAGRDRLDATIAANTYPNASRIILINPQGAYTAYSLPQGGGNWAHVDVRNPGKGTWTAYFAVPKTPTSKYNGPIHYGITTSQFVKANATLATPSFTLAPGASHTEVVHVREPKQPGDVSASVQFQEVGGPTTSVPLTERAAIARAGTFTDTLSGGNGRDTLAQAKLYYLDVPKHAKNLNVGIRIHDAALIEATLTAPSGQVASYQSNVDPTQQFVTPGLQFNQHQPPAGRWVLSVGVQTPASGNELSSPFQVTVGYGAAKVHAALPHSTKTRLKAGQPVKVPVTVHNTGTAKQVYFVDPRLNTKSTTKLKIRGVNQPFALPQKNSVAPWWLVPTQCTAMSVGATADQPVNLDIYYQSGEPEIYGPPDGHHASVRVKAPQLSPGPWGADVGQVGPFSGPATHGHVRLSGMARCNRFDTTVHTAAGDYWRTAKVPGSSLKLAPGQSGTIMVTIRPHGPHGKVVKGHLNVDTVDKFTGGGNVLAAIPYSYRIK